MPLTRKKDQATDDHYVGEHANAGKEYCCSYMKGQYKQIGNGSCSLIQKEKNDEQIIRSSKPGEQVGNPFFVHEFSNNRDMRFGGQPYFHGLCLNHPIVIQFCKSGKKIDNTNLEANNAYGPCRNILTLYRRVNYGIY